MQEDVLGPRKDVVGDDYVQCMRCGKAIRRRSAILLPADENPEVDTISGQEELCPACLAELHADD